MNRIIGCVYLALQYQAGPSWTPGRESERSFSPQRQLTGSLFWKKKPTTLFRTSHAQALPDVCYASRGAGGDEDMVETTRAFLHTWPRACIRRRNSLWLLKARSRTKAHRAGLKEIEGDKAYSGDPFLTSWASRVSPSNALEIFTDMGSQMKSSSCLSAVNRECSTRKWLSHEYYSK